MTFLGPTGASYDETLFVENPVTGYGTFMDNHSTANGTTYYLGTFAAGTEIEFGLDVLSSGSVWYDGPGTRNADGDVHAYMVNNYEGLADTTYVGFEDLIGSNVGGNADFNYVDEVYAFTGASATSSVPDTLSPCLFWPGPERAGMRSPPVSEVTGWFSPFQPPTTGCGVLF